MVRPVSIIDTNATWMIAANPMCSYDHEPPLPTVFTGYQGFCEVCADKYMVSHSIK